MAANANMNYQSENFHKTKVKKRCHLTLEGKEPPASQKEGICFASSSANFPPLGGAEFESEIRSQTNVGRFIPKGEWVRVVKTKGI